MSFTKWQPFCLGLNLFTVLRCKKYWTRVMKRRCSIDLLHKSPNAPVPYYTMHHYVTGVYTHVHISVTKWWDMMTSSNGNIFRVTGHLCGKFTGPRWISRTKASDASFDVFFDLRLNKRLSKQPWGWWFETPAWSLWRHRNDIWPMHCVICEINFLRYTNSYWVVWHTHMRQRNRPSLV